MTSPYEYMTRDWVLFGISAGDETSQMWEYMKSKGITPKEFIIYGNFRAFLEAQSISTSTPSAFHAGKYIGGLKEVRTYVNDVEETYADFS